MYVYTYTSKLAYFYIFLIDAYFYTIYSLHHGKISSCVGEDLGLRSRLPRGLHGTMGTGGGVTLSVFVERIGRNTFGIYLMNF